MRKIVDTNYLNNPELEAYLSSNRHNYAVLCDYAGIEAYRSRSPIAGICSSMTILSRYPKQVLVLKTTAAILKLKPKKAGFQRRMIEGEQTKDFSKFCLHIRTAQSGNLSIENQILAHAKAAVAFADKVVEDFTSLRSSILDLAQKFSSSELSALRSNKKWPPSLCKKFDQQFIGLIAHAYEADGQPVPELTLEELRYTFIFRYILCCYLLVLRWIASGYPPQKPEKLRNHMFDCTFAAYATVFDGFLSDDVEAITTYQAAAAFLSVR